MARRIVAELEQAAWYAAAVAQAEAGLLSLGFHTSLGAGPLRAAIAAHRKLVPKVVFDLVEGSPPDLMAALRERRIDVAVTVGAVLGSDLSILRLWDERLRAAVPADGPLAARESITWADLAAAPLVVRTWERGPVLYTFLAGRLTPHALMPEIAQHFVSREALLSVVSLGFGAAVVGGSAAGLAYPGVAFRPIAEPDATNPVSAVRLPDNDNPLRQKFEADVHHEVAARACDGCHRAQTQPAIFERLTDAVDAQRPPVERHAVVLVTAQTSPKTASMASGAGSPKPRRSRSRVGRCGSANQVVSSIAPLSTKRSRCGVRVSR